MKLKTKHVVKPNDADEIRAIVGTAIYMLTTFTSKMIGMHEVAIDAVFHSLEHRMVLDEIDCIPAHVW